MGKHWPLIKKKPNRISSDCIVYLVFIAGCDERGVARRRGQGDINVGSLDKWFGWKHIALLELRMLPAGADRQCVGIRACRRSWGLSRGSPPRSSRSPPTLASAWTRCPGCPCRRPGSGLWSHTCWLGSPDQVQRLKVRMANCHWKCYLEVRLV